MKQLIAVPIAALIVLILAALTGASSGGLVFIAVCALLIAAGLWGVGRVNNGR